MISDSMATNFMPLKLNFLDSILKSGFDTELSRFDTEPSRFNTKLSRFNTELSGFNTKLSGFNTELSGLNTKLSGFVFFQVMELFKIATFDQNLSLDGIPLTDNEKTLAQLSVFPSSVLELRVRLILFLFPFFFLLLSPSCFQIPIQFGRHFFAMSFQRERERERKNFREEEKERISERGSSERKCLGKVYSTHLKVV